MPENKNENREFDFNDLPSLNKTENNVNPILNHSNEQNNQSTPEQKPLIEIPKEYYEKIEAEKQAKEKLEHEKEEQKRIASSSNGDGTNILFISLLNAVVFYVLINLMITKNEMFLIAIPIYIAIASILFGITRKKESNYPAGTIMGGMITAIVTFILSLSLKENSDLLTHYAMCSAITGFAGYLIANTITKIIYDFKNIKAVETLGIIIFFASLIGVPYYLYQKYPNEFSKIVFQKQTEVKATTQSEFIEKTLKNRYNVDIKCDENTIKNQIDQQLRKITLRTCKTSSGVEFEVTIKAYNEGGVQYIVEDELFNVLYLNDLEKKLKDDLTITLGAEKINLSLFPKENCRFVGDCANCDAYYKVYERENDIDKQYEISSKLNLEKFLNLEPKEFVNKYEFRFIIDVIGTYTQVDQTYIDNLVNSTLNRLNELGYHNTYGYEIEIQDSYNYNKVIYRVTDETNNDKSFKDPVLDTDY